MIWLAGMVCFVTGYVFARVERRLYNRRVARKLAEDYWLKAARDEPGD